MARVQTKPPEVNSIPLPSVNDASAVAAVNSRMPKIWSVSSKRSRSSLQCNTAMRRNN